LEQRITDEDFHAIAAMLFRKAGIRLADNKRELVCGRLNPRLRHLGLDGFASYRALIEAPEGQDECLEMVNALTTNLTSFFREPHHFRYLADEVLKDFRGRADRRLRIWSAACSSGEEPYSIAMTLRQVLRGAEPRDARILATDIDTNMIATAELGCYSADRAAGIPDGMGRLVVRRPDGGVEMSEALQRLITFKPLNLLGAWPMRGKFDAVFCRNVVIYFDKPTQRALFDRIADVLVPGGTLFIGHSESLFRVSDRFESLGHTIYRKVK
jgi:chemotaxis protein methyltransferase CheR